ncbi:MULTISPECIES: ectonucleotide pyrophosphatase/phosphodiesterase [unclassified Brevundimonas]|uniref:alkaline phosphatase family protein n=1 Tax=unclassified Brevundimonas TaxID=2622653 RepID=UPI0025C400F8|nr:MULTISPECIES: ectonucleotide pyrophosphatase/phosphodiesterase [unclassified Brevundimonas]
MATPSMLRNLLLGSAMGLGLLVGGCATGTVQSQGTAVVARAQAEQPTTVILVSIDGFRAEYLNRGITPNLSRLAAEGASGAMKPSFPTVTFPNHYTLVTGLHPDHHGIVGNNMRDAELGSFSLGNRAAVTDRRWWDDGEPIWVTAEKQGIVTGTMFWPGSEADVRGVRPTHWAVFDQSMPGDVRVDRLLEWLDLPQEQRPRLNTLYFDLVDTMGHRHGPDSAEVTEAIVSTDASIGRLMEGLKARGLDKNAVVLVVSDHGMAATSPDRVSYLDERVAADALNVVYSGPVAFVNAAPGRDAEVASAIVGKHDHYECWRKADIPARFALGTHRRVTDFVCLAENGWLVGTSDRRMTRPGGAHGYDNEWSDMHAIFIAHGKGVAAGRQLQNIDSVDVQPLLGRLLGIEVPKGDGNAADTLPVTQN